jgi:septal ring factor EnvC (AmiA/AmiB activator)
MIVGRNIILFCVCLFFCSITPAVAQKSKALLQKEKQQNLKKIKEVEKILSETAVKKRSSIGELTALNERISEQEKLIISIKDEVNLLNLEIGENNGIIQVLEEDLEKLKKEYASMIFAAQKANNSATRLTFLFSAQTFDQLIMRLKYMEQYGDIRKLQADQIMKVQDELGGQVKSITKRREEKSRLLNDEVTENNNLTNLKTKKSRLVKSLEKEEKKLKRDLEQTKKAVANLDKLINEIIKEELAREASANRSNEVTALSATFEDNKTKFPWPVSGFISQKFGRQNHPVLKGIVIQNDGINIQTKENEKVSCIFDGEVRKVAFIPTLGSTVIIKHGEYLSVYTGLKEVSVKVGQKVSTNQAIGKVLSNGDGISELRFRIHKNTTPLDPQAWLRHM